MTRPAPSTLLRRLAVPALAVAAVAAVPSGASAAGNCPTSGKTLAVSLSSDPTPVPIARVWRSGGKTYGCTTTSGIAPKTRLLTTRKASLVRLDFDTVGWTAKVKRKGKTVTRVWAYDLANGKPWLSGVQPVPARAEGDPREEGSVDQLRVGSGLMVAWVANGSTVVVGAKTPDTIELVEEGAAAPLFSDGGLAVAGSYEADAAARGSLRSSLKIAPVPGDHGDADDCEYQYLTAVTWKIGGPDALEARIAGSRATPYTCP
ncbi:hypothetical protein [Patulibacter minatonensis]|uniref:hypothetical protein n=1 Tax=Patulibacter minatonensis TaxID=298163 RepID=UPI00047AEDA1|nr:hypothetical protein [Patulibacter minatonensis]